jgi:hypothetical protein
VEFAKPVEKLPLYMNTGERIFEYDCCQDWPRGCVPKPLAGSMASPA